MSGHGVEVIHRGKQFRCGSEWWCTDDLETTESIAVDRILHEGTIEWQLANVITSVHRWSNLVNTLSHWTEHELLVSAQKEPQRLAYGQKRAAIAQGFFLPSHLLQCHLKRFRQIPSIKNARLANVFDGELF